MDSSITITGNAASDIAFKSGVNDQGRRWARAEFRLASTRRARQADGSWGDVGTTFVTVQAWNALAEGVLGSIEKGQPVVVSGRLRSDEWADANGELRSRLLIAADAVGHDLSRGRTKFVKNAPIPDPEPVEARDEPDAERPKPGQEPADGEALGDEYESVDPFVLAGAH